MTAINAMVTSALEAPRLPHTWMTLHEQCIIHFIHFCQLSFISFILQCLASKSQGGGALNSCAHIGMELNCLHQHGGEQQYM